MLQELDFEAMFLWLQDTFSNKYVIENMEVKDQIQYLFSSWVNQAENSCIDFLKFTQQFRKS